MSEGHDFVFSGIRCSGFGIWLCDVQFFCYSSDINSGTTKAPASYRNDTEADINWPPPKRKFSKISS